MACLITIEPANVLTGTVIMREFSKYGKIVQVGFEGNDDWRVAYVRFQNNIGAKNASANSEIEINGRIYKVEYIENEESATIESQISNRSKKRKLRSEKKLDPTPKLKKSSSKKNISKLSKDKDHPPNQNPSKLLQLTPSKSLDHQELQQNTSPTPAKPTYSNMSKLVLPSFLRNETNESPVTKPAIPKKQMKSESDDSDYEYYSNYSSSSSYYTNYAYSSSSYAYSD